MRQSVFRGAPFGERDWQQRTAARLQLTSSLRPHTAHERSKTPRSKPDPLIASARRGFSSVWYCSGARSCSDAATSRAASSISLSGGSAPCALEQLTKTEERLHGARGENDDRDLDDVVARTRA